MKDGGGGVINALLWTREAGTVETVVLGRIISGGGRTVHGYGSVLHGGAN